MNGCFAEVFTLAKRRKILPAFRGKCGYALLLDLLQLRRPGQRGHHAGHFAALEQDALNVGISDRRSQCLCPGFGVAQNFIHLYALTLVVFRIQRREKPRTAVKMIVNHRFSHPRLGRQIAQRQGIGSFLANNMPGDVY